ncbi:hypothetical protein M093_1776 [Bacteroides uniformis str. 3978 T3 i]|nr:hypothetical protein M093_1776 [Bacteroides uniformis str. 3978 T3 i]
MPFHKHAFLIEIDPYQWFISMSIIVRNFSLKKQVFSCKTEGTKFRNSQSNSEFTPVIIGSIKESIANL